MTAPPITELIDAGTVQGIADEVWVAMLGEDEFLVPLPAELPTETVSAWVSVSGPWNGAVVLTCAPATAEELTRFVLQAHPPELLENGDVTDAFGELANVLGGNVKSLLPGPSKLGLPEVGTTPSAGSPVDTCRVDAVWRGHPLSITVQGAAAPVHPERNEVPL
ncbi:chemotaxis protein CheX [Modestobacter sp. I12A-02628]|uniref:Chemotaxis protein CheX n=1 Tax=Goekera deserti TaxID=2497753 RepID=A0A7K3WFM6_9ACTN|nr:chemotaxis protein CheX [Goekera deserti]MPR00093.1 chemotaxis protein CheX [Goekera deserti]NDI49872.1 chemotaxis protein CheX [Goekera deserti]NEL55234.1 chemotaxis protein CheX [Goekera deserti]